MAFVCVHFLPEKCFMCIKTIPLDFESETKDQKDGLISPPVGHVLLK